MEWTLANHSEDMLHTALFVVISGNLLSFSMGGDPFFANESLYLQYQPS